MNGILHTDISSAANAYQFLARIAVQLFIKELIVSRIMDAGTIIKKTSLTTDYEKVYSGYSRTGHIEMSLTLYNQLWSDTI